MTLRHWNLLTEVLGFISALLLLWPAVTQNAKLRHIVLTRQIFSSSKLPLAKEMGLSKAMADAALPRWSRTDQWLLTSGAISLSISFLIKVVVVWNS